MILELSYLELGKEILVDIDFIKTYKSRIENLAMVSIVPLLLSLSMLMFPSDYFIPYK